MQSRMEARQWETLTKQFRLSANVNIDEGSSVVKAADLLDQAKGTAYLDSLAARLGSTSRLVAASMFAKRYAFLTVAPGLYAMTIFNKAIQYGLEQVLLESASGAGESWISSVRLTGYEVSEPEAGAREQWREATLRALFAGNTRTLWKALSDMSKVPLPILWENTAVRVYSLYEKKIGAGAGPEERARIDEDYAYLVRQAPAALFGEKHNPLAQYYRGDACSADGSPAESAPTAARMRTTCCFYYQVASDGEYCTACPKAGG